MLAIFSVAIGLGSLVSPWLANGQVNRRSVIIGALGLSLFIFCLLAFNFTRQTSYVELAEFSRTVSGVFNFIFIFCMGFCAGLYSVTCYNELQITAPMEQLSQVIAVNNVINAAYMVLASLVATILLLVISLWWLFMLLAVCNLLFVLCYYRVNRNQLDLASNAI